MSLFRVSRNTDLTQAERTIKLVPLAMAIPNVEGVYTLSNYREPKVVTEQEWYTYNPRLIRIGTPDNWNVTTAYGKGLDCWYITVEA